MPGQIFLPDDVARKINDHLQSAAEATVEDYPSASEDEDTLVGHFGAKAQIRNQKVLVEQVEMEGIWTWSVEYTKFRGRGAGATENFLGADGIMRLTVNYGGRAKEKSALFQAKIEGTSDRDLLTQCAKLSTWREASFILNFRAAGIEAATLDAVIRNAGAAPRELQGEAFAKFFAERFLPCKIGDEYLSYDAIRKILKWRAMDSRGHNHFVATKFRVRHRLALAVEAPQRRSATPPLVGVDEIHNYRMSASVEDIFNLPHGFTQAELTSKRNELAYAYHPDRYVTLNLDADAMELLQRRMQEFNVFVDEVKAGKRQ